MNHKKVFYMLCFLHLRAYVPFFILTEYHHGWNIYFGPEQIDIFLNVTAQ